MIFLMCNSSYGFICMKGHLHFIEVNYCINFTIKYFSALKFILYCFDIVVILINFSIIDFILLRPI